MLEILAGLSAFTGAFAIISPKTPLAKRVFNKIGVKNEFLDKNQGAYHKAILFVTVSIIFLTILLIIAYFDYSKLVIIVLYTIILSGFFTVLYSFGLLFRRKNKKTNNSKSLFIRSLGNKPLIVFIATLLISFVLLNTATPIYDSKEMNHLYENLKKNDIPLHTLISNQELNKTEFANKFENIIKLTQKAQLMQDYERYYKEGIAFTCDPKVRNTNHSKVERDMFVFLCNNFDDDFIDIYIPQIKNAYYAQRLGLTPEAYPLNWLIKATEKQSYKLSRLVLNIRLVIGNVFLFIKSQFQSISSIIIGTLILSLCYFISVKTYNYNKKHDETSTGPTFIFYAAFSLISFFTFIWSITI